MLIIHSKLVQAMLDQARQDHPIETCGIIAGQGAYDLPLRLIPMRNAACAKDFFEFDPHQQRQVRKEMAARGEVPIVIYHSHTESQTYPSLTDVKYATEPRAHYVIIPTDKPFNQEIRSFRIREGMITEERIQQVSAYQSDLEPLMVA